MTLKRKLLVFVSLVILVVTALLTTSAYLQFRQSLEADVVAKVVLTNTQTAGRIGEWLDGKLSAISTVAKAQPAKEFLTKALSIANDSGHFSVAYAGFEDGDMVYSDGRSPKAGYDPRKRPWYQLAQQTNKLSVTEPYIDATTSDLVITVVMPGKDGDGKRFGVYGGDVFINDIVKTVLAIDLGEQGTAMLVDGKGQIIAYKDKNQVLKPFSNVVAGINASELARLDQAKELTAVTLDGTSKLAKVTHVDGSDWYLMSLVDPDEVFASLDNLLTSAILICLVIFVVFIALAVVGLSRLLRPLAEVSAALHEVASGQGDLTKRLAVNSNDELGKISANFNAFIEHIQPIMRRVAKAADDLNDEADKGMKNAVRTDHEVNQQQQEITQVATAMHEMAVAANEVAQHAEETAHAARSSAKSCEQGMGLVKRNRDSIVTLASEIESSTNVINELNRHAQGISSILATIQGVAEQTNLLALNAAIEAARAGEQGRGFAVVADEVRVLSQRTHSSTEEIQKMIEQLQNTTRTAVQYMEKSGQLATSSVVDAESVSNSLGEITDSINQISDRAVQIASAAEEQKAVSDDISRNTTSIKEVADELAVAAAESRKGAERLTDVADLLKREMGQFKL
ncbi:methyl-accepting chemotaxis protein [Pokkaliibacter sp. MBI-7]|uniref:methyl-accepting chemotaxis protein n=1 Tax=Pokkaliibacter sp. MBI-7 TaxID=3040600 RepID=UPI00244B155A|nr:methyl-accepting chemotaxis protein [Pokkaliibacter sp. MBI-7]MDH2436032.1 methyl-accepting chemotaxis protein [Pokkaliibacter sp. MBI-7]